MNQYPKILVYGYGNPGRQDDALGVLLAENIRSWTSEKKSCNISVETNYQLNIEDAANINGKDLVVFADASKEDIEDFILTDLAPAAKVEFSMHQVSPAFVLYLCGNLFETFPKSFMLHIKGYSWDFQEGLTEKGCQNLNKASEYIKSFITNYISEYKD